MFAVGRWLLINELELVLPEGVDRSGGIRKVKGVKKSKTRFRRLKIAASID